MASVQSYKEAMGVTGFTVEEVPDNVTDIVDHKNIPPGGNQEEYISSEMAQAIQGMITIVLIPIFCSLGSIGNLLSLKVLFHQRMRNQTNYILAALCVSDTLFLIHSLVFSAVAIQVKTNPIDGLSNRAQLYPIVGAYTSVVTARITSGLTTLLCIERFIAVYYPMQAHMTCTKRNTVIAIVLIYVSTFLVFLPFAFKWTAITVQTPMNTTITRGNFTQFYFDNVTFYTIYGTLLNVIYRFLPLLIIPVLNIKMIGAVRRTWKLRRKMSSGNHNTASRRFSGKSESYRNADEENHITIMLLTVSFVFFICILPGALNSIGTHIWEEYSRKGHARHLYITLMSITYLLETINSSVNFIIYMACSKTFRSLYKNIFCCSKTEFYINASLSSIKEKFKLTSNRRRTSTELFGRSETGLYGRRTASDVGPLRKSSSCPKKSLSSLLEVHSEGFEIRANGITLNFGNSIRGDKINFV